MRRWLISLKLFYILVKCCICTRKFNFFAKPWTGQCWISWECFWSSLNHLCEYLYQLWVFHNRGNFFTIFQVHRNLLGWQTRSRPKYPATVVSIVVTCDFHAYLSALQNAHLISPYSFVDFYFHEKLRTTWGRVFTSSISSFTPCRCTYPSLAAVASRYAIYASFVEVEMERTLSLVKSCERGRGQKSEAKNS